MAIYIRSAQSISPQDTFMKSELPEVIVAYDDILKCILPDFKNYFAPLERRRMSRIIKMGVACAEEAIKEAEIEKPDTIISGTGLGCVEDTEKFLHNVLTTEEGLLTPTAFVQSTHNSIGASIALKYNCKGYNMLHAHKTISFESALLDASLIINDDEADTVLVGGFDEITRENYELKRQVGIFKKDSCSNHGILKSVTNGSLAGEGCNYFVLTKEKSSRNYAQIELVNFTHQLKGITKVKEWITQTLDQKGITTEEIDNFLVGVNGDASGDKLYYELIDQMFKSSNSLYYKHMCGEYDTASAFGMYLSAKMLKSNSIPDSLFINKTERFVRNILIYNQDANKNHSLILLSKV